MVINLSFGWGGPGQVTEVRLNTVIKELIMNYLAIIFVPAGEDGTGTNRPIESWPAPFADLLPLIVVGAVDPANGKTHPGSPGGRLLTVTAPGGGLLPERTRRWYIPWWSEIRSILCRGDGNENGLHLVIER